jgi:hypothetical protein
MKNIFPRRIENHPSSEGSKQARFAFNQDYVSHLTSVMTLTSDTLNEFLQVSEPSHIGRLNTTMDRHLRKSSIETGLLKL